MKRPAYVYTAWNDAPLAWHRFLTYFSLPLSVIVTIGQLVYYYNLYSAPEVKAAWDFSGLGWTIFVDLFLSVSQIALMVFSFLVVNVIYYRKRRLLFLPLPADGLSFLLAAAQTSDPTPPSTPVPPPAPEAELKPDTEPKPEPSSSVDLLMQIQAKEELCQAATSDAPATPGKRSATIWLPVVLGLLCVILCVSSFSLWRQNTALTKENGQLSKSLSASKREVDHLTKSHNNIQSELDEAQAENTFWQAYYVLVTPTGRKYHNYGCPYLSDAPISIYRISSADFRGYTPCSHCDPFEYGSRTHTALKDTFNVAYYP